MRESPTSERERKTLGWVFTVFPNDQSERKGVPQYSLWVFSFEYRGGKMYFVFYL